MALVDNQLAMACLGEPPKVPPSLAFAATPGTSSVSFTATVMTRLPAAARLIGMVNLQILLEPPVSGVKVLEHEQTIAFNIFSTWCHEALNVELLDDLYLQILFQTLEKI